MEVPKHIQEELESHKGEIEELLKQYKQCNNRYDREKKLFKVLDIISPLMDEMCILRVRQEFSKFVNIDDMQSLI